MASSEGGTFELMLMRKAGARFEAEFPARLARNRDRSMFGCVTTFRDVSERNRHETELERE